MKCALCGFEFSEAQARRPCQSCPMGSKCDLICCPSCGYQTPQEPRWLRRWRSYWKQQEDACAGTLAALPPGSTSEITEVRPDDAKTVRKLTALGLVPGVRVRVLRRFPCYLVQVGYAQIALDRELASAIIVRERASKLA